VIPDEENIFLNSWNIKQVILIEGELDISIRIRDLIESIKASDIIPKVQLH
jgi:hypothetical protein